MKTLAITGFRVLIRPDPIEEVSKSGIVLIASKMQERKEMAAQMTGVILAIGRTAWKAFDKGPDWQPWAKVGDHVVYTRYGARYVPDPEDTEQTLAIINDEDVLAVINET